MEVNDIIHIPVLRDKVIKYFNSSTVKIKRFVDCTIGCGGHAAHILKNYPDAVVLGIDRDASALNIAKTNLKFAGDRVIFKKGNFSNLTRFIKDIGWKSIDGVLLDLGISSLQLDDPMRGFSFIGEAPLDMRMDLTIPNTASRILNFARKDELEKIFKEYGEIKKAAKLANAIIMQRQHRPFVSTQELVEICEKVLGRYIRKGVRSVRLCFQALRIAVNNELEELNSVISQAVDLLITHGRIGVITFHSLEDRIVKNKFKEYARECICPPDLPVCRCNHRAILRIITKKPVKPSREEIAKNRRASSAKLRVAEKLS